MPSEYMVVVEELRIIGHKDGILLPEFGVFLKEGGMISQLG